MLQGSSPSEGMRVLILAPYGRDGVLIRGELQTAGFASTICASMEELCSMMWDGAGAALIGDEALVAATIEPLARQLKNQPRWSDFPLLIMTSGGASTRASRYRLRLLEPLGNVALLERPLRPVTLISSLRAALRNRRRQYELCNYLTRIESGEQALRASEARFRFLADLSEAARAVTQPNEVTAIVARRLRNHLGAADASYSTMDAGGEQALRPALRTRTSRGLDLALLGPRALADLRSGRTIAIRNVEREVPPGAGRDMFLSIGARAIICCPLVKEGNLIALLSVEDHVPRDWTSDEVALGEEVVERCWAYKERERLVAELAENNSVLKRTNEDLTRVNRELEEFAYVASHDLQEPIRMVQIYTHLMLKVLGNPDPTLKQYSDFVRQGAGRMEELIGDLLRFSRLVHAETPVACTAELSAALAEATSVLKNRIEESGAVVHSTPLPVVRGDARQLAHVFQNLISNSIKYRKLVESPRIEIWAEKEEDRWVIAVRDNGIGFEQQYAERIFGLFKRLHKDEYPGTGLGLAICQRIVERYGGRMWAVSKTGQGATFYFSLPSAEAQRPGLERGVADGDAVSQSEIRPSGDGGHLRAAR
jgi:signal transduction histidine kinase